jgi:hypothetical protein
LKYNRPLEQTRRKAIVNMTSNLTTSEEIQKRIDLQRLYIKEQQAEDAE